MGLEDVTSESRFKIVSNDYFDVQLIYNGNPESLRQYEQYSVQIMNVSLAIIYIPISQVTPRLITQYGYNAIPKCYTLTDAQSLDESGVTRLRNTPALNLRGNGVLVGMIDTGIDYTNPVFQRADGTSKILSLWDQTIDSVDGYPKLDFPPLYGTEYTQEQINQALRSPNPREIVPSVDENGHGTKLAGIVAGSENRENNFSGVVPDADLIVVKLKQAKRNLTDYFFIPPTEPCYQENDIIWGMQYLIETARKLRRPISICIGIGTSQGAHNNAGYLNNTVSTVGDFPGICISTSGGNEGNARRHFYSAIPINSPPVPIELNVAENETGFTLEIWGEPPMTYSVDILSPTGEYVPTIFGKLEETRTIRFIFEQTLIYLDYILIENETGNQVILMRFQNPTPGTWRFQITGRGDLNGSVHSWLPAGNFILQDTYFIRSNPYTTLTSPGNSFVPLTIVAYNQANGSLYINSGKGYSTSNLLNPDFAAPGVNVQCPGPNNTFTTLTGTSAATAHTTGIAAMILEWGIVRNNYTNIDTIGIKKFLIRGARRNPQLLYPNRDWGYGMIDIFNTFNIFRTDVT